MTQFVKHKLQRPFVQRVLVMISGTTGAQAITLLASPLITRIYGPEAFGILGIFLAVSMMLMPSSALGYDQAIVLAKHEKEAIGLTKIALFFSSFIALFSCIIAGVFGERILEFLKFTDIKKYIYFIPLMILFGGLFRISQQWAVRLQEFKLLAKVNIFQALIIQGSIVGIGLVYPFASILIFLNVLGQLLRAMFIELENVKRRKLKNIFSYSHSPLKGIAYKYRDFPKYRAPEMFLSAATLNLPILLLTSFSGPVSAGFFTLSKRVLDAPATLIGNSVGNVFYPRITKAYYNNENLNNLIKKATLGLVLVGAIPYSLVFLSGPWLFEIVFGGEWLQAGIYARWMALDIFFNFINKPSVKALPVLSAQRFQLIFTIVRLIIRSVMLVLGLLIFKNDILAIALFSISGALLNLFLIIVTLNISKKIH
ncbi:hypothetical protein AAV35_002550 [Salimicrobium jeotgali]|uniref:Polysaccharide biosynthesis protein n=1 Tax=Salimicrobium jeotgali TaxID=1230341 RepID=K2FJM6_9BACI|nr:oligosaccharide flippase family protein [Salimicrobium jeotgali]AKG03778.1 hypothetical protein AAV35_002550 [Salimicrobium jeotgali]EKE31261.1 polysaccharide biosynthesis protein [Salimicrobium jeotgali]MBM7697074.1 O-antigen/teichoic acid export membrane protein [Salimicrobium jeotgali]